jgi:hypothetical protein
MAAEEFFDLSEVLGSFGHGDSPTWDCNTKVTRFASVCEATA